MFWENGIFKFLEFCINLCLIVKLKINYDFLIIIYTILDSFGYKISKVYSKRLFLLLIYLSIAFFGFEKEY